MESADVIAEILNFKMRHNIAGSWVTTDGEESGAATWDVSLSTRNALFFETII